MMMSWSVAGGTGYGEPIAVCVSGGSAGWSGQLVMGGE